jgi:putative transposase
MNRTFQYRLYPTSRQATALGEMLRDHCDLYNAALQERRDAYRMRGTPIRYGMQSGQLKDIRNADPLGQGRWSFSSQQQTLRRIDKAFAAFFSRVKRGEKPGYPRFRSSRRFDTVTFVDGDGGKWLDNTIRVQGVGCIKVKLHRPVRGIVKQFSITRQGRHWYVNVICVDVPVQPKPFTGAVVGLDRGVTHLVADSDGRFVDNIRPLKTAAGRLVAAQRDLARKKRKSHRRHRAVARVAALHRKVSNVRRNHLHKVARSYVDAYDLIVVEDLKVKNMTRSASGIVEEPGTNVAQKSGLNRSILDAGWGVLLELIRQKAEEAVVEVIEVNPRNTSRTCHACGHVAAGNRNGETFRCQGCGHCAHADTNAAQNILRLGLSLQAAVAS